MELLIVLTLAMIVLVVQTICKTYLKIRNSEEAVGNLLVVEDEDGEMYVFAEFTYDLNFLEDGDTVTLIVDKHTRKKNNDSYED